MITKDNVVIYDASVRLEVDAAYGKNFKDMTTRLDNAVYYKDVVVPEPFFGNWYIYDSITKEFNLTSHGIVGIKQYLLEKLKIQKASVEYTGIILNGNMIKTDIISQQYINGMYNTAINNSSITIMFKYGNGVWEEIDKNKIIEIAEKVSNHVESCFRREFQITENIKNLETFSEFKNIENNMKLNWPTISEA